MHQQLREYCTRLPLWLQIVVVGVLCGLGFVSVYTTPLLLVGLVLLVLLFDTSEHMRQSMVIGWGVWFIQSLFVGSWLWHAYPIDWVPFNSNVVQFGVIGFHWFTFALWLSVTGLVFGLGYWYIRQYAWPLWLKSIILAGLVVLAEQVGALVFSLATLGSDMAPNTYFSLGFLGNVVSHIPSLISYAAIGGVYILSGLVILYAVSVVALVRQQAWVQVITFTVGIVVVGYILQLVVVPTHANERGTVAVITTDFTARFLQDESGHKAKQAALQAAVTAAYAETPDYILLPEDSRYIENAYEGVTPERAFGYHRFTFGDPTTILVDSGRVDLVGATAVMRATVFDGVSKQVTYQDKPYLAPQGEYISYFYETAFRLLGYGEMVDEVKLKQSYRPGSELTAVADATLPILFCFSSVNPRGVSSLPGVATAPFIAHPISHAWFHNPYILWHQLDTALRIQAVWNQLPIISAANGAESLVYQSDGSITIGETVASGDLWEVRIVDLADL